MKYLGKITDDKDLVTKEYVDDSIVTYESKAAASGGTDVSLCTTGEKYLWNSAASGGVSDVTLNGTSVVSSGTAALPDFSLYSSNSNYGYAFGTTASAVDKLEVAWDAQFDSDLTVSGDATVTGDAEFGSDIYIDLPDYQTSGTTDYEIYEALVDLGWDSDVLS